MKKLLFAVIAILMLNTSKNEVSAQTQTPGLDILGYGYDVFGEYADQASKKKYCLFKYTNFTNIPIGSNQYSVPEYVFLENISKHILKKVSGESMREYSKSQSASVGLGVDAMFFSASVNSSFGKSSSGSEQHFYFTYRDANTKWRISFDERDYDNLDKILDPRFKQDLATMEPAKLFELYGTHYIASAYLGGRADYNTVSVITSKTNTSDISVAVEASYGAVSGNASVSSIDKKTLSNSKTTSKLTVTGGNSEFANNISDPVAYQNWAAGIATMPVLCDFDENSLKPIWDFCTTDKRKAILKAEFEKMLRTHPLPAISLSKTYLIKNKANSLYWDFEGFSSAAQKNKGILKLAKKGVNGQGFDRIFKTTALNENDLEVIYFQPQHCNLVLAISGGSKEANANFMLSTYNAGFKSQKYILESIEGTKNQFRIKVKYSNMYVTAKGGTVIQTKKTDSNAQIWIFEEFNPKDIAPPTSAFYAVKSLAVNKYWDFAGKYPNVTGTKLISTSMEKQEGDRVYKFVKITNTNDYLIRPGHEKSRVLTARKSGEQLIVFEQTRSDNQLFNFEYGGSPNSYIIIHKGTKSVITLRKDRIQMQGAEIKISKKEAGNPKYQQWFLKFHK